MEFYTRVDALVQQAVLGDGFGVEVTSTLAGLPLVDSPTPILVSASLYLVVVVAGLVWIGVKELKPRASHDAEPAWLQALVIAHNLLCFVLSLYMSVGITYQAVTHGYSLLGNTYCPEEREMAVFLYLFYMSKYVEFMDTIIMLLKRSTRQISFLHVYHHSSVSVIWWAVVHHSPGGDGVHVFMYGYYFLAALLRSNPKLRAKYLFWGRYLTQFQMFQFILNLIHAYCGIKMNMPTPQWLYKTLFYYMISLLCLFGNFYVHKYIKLAKGAKAE